MAGLPQTKEQKELAKEQRKQTDALWKGVGKDLEEIARTPIGMYLSPPAQTPVGMTGMYGAAGIQAPSGIQGLSKEQQEQNDALWAAVEEDVRKNVIDGNPYERSRYITGKGLDIAEFFLPGALIKGGGKAAEAANLYAKVQKTGREAEAAGAIADTGYKTFDDLRYEKHWKDLESGIFDIPYGMTEEEYYQYLKGLDKVDQAIKGGRESVQHAVGSANQAQSVLNGIDPQYFNAES